MKSLLNLSLLLLTFLSAIACDDAVKTETIETASPDQEQSGLNADTGEGKAAESLETSQVKKEK